DLWLPRPLDRIGRDRIGEDADRPAVHPVAGAGTIPAHQGHDDQLWLARAVEVGETDAVDRRLLADRVHGPGRIDGRPLLEPLERAAGFGVGQVPAGPEGKIDLAVAVDVGRRDTDVVRLGLLADDRPHLPGRVLEPDDAVGIGDDNVRLAVGVN